MLYFQKAHGPRIAAAIGRYNWVLLCPPKGIRRQLVGSDEMRPEAAQPETGQGSDKSL